MLEVNESKPLGMMFLSKDGRNGDRARQRAATVSVRLFPELLPRGLIAFSS
jgi:hypothetical protein